MPQHTPSVTLPGGHPSGGAPPAGPPTPPEVLRRSAVLWLGRHLLDRQEGGVHRAAPAVGGSPIAGHKHLYDQSAAVLAFADDAPDELPVALRGLHALLDRDGLPGFSELADRSWRIRPEGRVRTLHHQFQAATALLVGSGPAADTVARVRAVDLLNRCLSTGRDGVFPGRVSEDWTQALDEGPSPLAMVAAVRALTIADALGESGADAEQLPLIAAALGAFVRELPSPGCHPQIALALAHAANLLGSDEHADTAHRVLDQTTRHFTSAADTVGISGGDAADLLLAGAVVRSRGHDDRGATAVSRAAIDLLADRRHGGFHTDPAQIGSPTAVKYARVQSTLAGALGAASALPPYREDPPADDPDI